MKNKRLIIILSVFAFLVLIAVLCSTVFTVKKVSLNWLTTAPNLSESAEELIAEVPKGDSVFLVDKKEIVSKLEKKSPYLKVVDVEVKFPNKLVLHVAERQELYSVKIKDDKYAILDSECKVLRVVGDAELNKLELKPVPVTILGYKLTEADFEVCETANITWLANVMQKCSQSFLARWNNDPTNIKNNLKGGMVVDIESGANMNIKITTSYGVVIQIDKISDYLTEKLQFGIGIYDDLDPTQKKSGIITVYTIADRVKGEYTP